MKPMLWEERSCVPRELEDWWITDIQTLPSYQGTPPPAPITDEEAIKIDWSDTLHFKEG